MHTKSSTSVITIIRYGKKAHAKIVYKSDVPDKTFELDDVGMKDLHSIAFMESASERENHNVKEVQVYLPLKILKVLSHFNLNCHILFSLAFRPEC